MSTVRTQYSRQDLDEIKRLFQFITVRINTLPQNASRDFDKTKIEVIENALKQLLKIGSEHPRTYLLQGLLHEVLGENNEALAKYSYAQKNFPQCWNAYLYAAKLLEKMGEFAESISLLKKVINFDYKSHRLPPSSQPLKSQLEWAKTTLTMLYCCLRDKKFNDSVAALEAQSTAIPPSPSAQLDMVIAQVVSPNPFDVLASEEAAIVGVAKQLATLGVFKTKQEMFKPSADSAITYASVLKNAPAKRR